MMTAAEYFENVGAYGKHGPEGKTFMVINSNQFETPWIMWMLYFQKMGMGSTVTEMKKAWKTGVTWTVPTEDPHTFDGGLNIYSEEIDNARRFLNGPVQGNEEGRLTFVESELKKFHMGRSKISAAQKIHDKRGDDLAEVRELILEKRRNSPEYKKQQEAAEREAVKFSERRSKKLTD